MAGQVAGPPWYRVMLTVLSLVGVLWFSLGRAWVHAAICALAVVLGVVDVLRLRRSADVPPGDADPGRPGAGGQR